MQFVLWDEKLDPLQEHVKILCLVILRIASYNMKANLFQVELCVYNNERNLVREYIQA